MAQSAQTGTAQVPGTASGDEVFRPGEIVGVEGRPGEWELMEPGPGPDVWTVEAARLEDRVSEQAAVSALRRLADAPHVRRGDLVMQSYPEQERAAVVGAVFRLGQWVAEKSYTLPGGDACRTMDSVDRLEVVTPQQLAAAIRLDVAHGAHQGRIVQAVVSSRAGQFRVVCRCAPGAGEVCRDGRKVTWCHSLDSARALWDWHVSQPAPVDGTS
ncbi:hypothetical protein HET69_22860 [Streptomyces sp. CJ_13]|uniref:hypothetical protein n=1 Tax=Streptomyces sp. CJ_13 TaxID=2724943 RepID=UPI001BDBBA53|nr:hypothetical protein [Streptomyces sp. CJ_13]MBT1186761.1 hypothetical protein [Streptomyces sp. CJ_13]